MSTTELGRRSCGTAAPIEPRSSELLGSYRRRVAAALVDATIVVGGTFGVATTQVETTTLAASATGGNGAAGSGLLRIAGWAVGVSGGDALVVTSPGGRHVLAGLPLAITVGAWALISLITLVLIPANVGGATPGKRLVGLRVLTEAGCMVGLRGHLFRTMVAIVDLAPWLVPGLVGLVMASRSPTRQRLGDRIAGTKVVGSRHPDRPPAPAGRAMHHRRTALPEPTSETGAGQRRAPRGGSRRLPEVAVDSAVARPARDSDSIGRLPDVDVDSAVAQPARDSFDDPPADGRPEDRSDRRLPDVDVSSAKVQPAPVSDGVAGNGRPERNGDRCLPDVDIASAMALAARDGGGVAADGRLERAGDRRLPDVDVESAVARAEGDGGRGADVDVVSAVARAVEVAPQRGDERAEGVEASRTDESSGRPRAGQGENLVWSDEHQAWMYRDPASRRWLRHDVDQDRWVLVD